MTTRSEQAAERRRGRVVEMSGPTHRLPVMVTPSELQSVTLAEVRAFLTRVIRAGLLTLDIESTGYPLGHAHHRVRTVQLGDDTAAVVLAPEDPDQARIIAIALANAPAIGAYSAPADICPLVHMRLIQEECWERVLDASLTARLGSSGVKPQDGLKAASAAVLEASMSPSANAARIALAKAGKWLVNIKADTPVERSFWAQADRECETMLRYAGSDVLDTAALAQALPPVSQAVQEREHRLQRITARLSQHGLRLDPERVAQLHETYRVPYKALEASLTEFVENPNSPQQVGRWLTQEGVALPPTQTGWSVEKGTLIKALAALSEDDEAYSHITSVLEYRRLGKLLSTYLEPYQALIDYGDGRVRPMIYTLGADTGRMSSARPNLQNVPRSGGIRSCIVADEGQAFVSADLAGIELRVMAALSGDTELTRVLLADEDLHLNIARVVWGEGATKADRYKAKPVVYGCFYGGGVQTLALQVGEPEAIVASVIEVLWDMCPELAEWSRSIQRDVRRGLTQYPMYSGRTLFLDSAYPHKSPNWIVQGTAREIMVDGMERYEASRFGGGIVLPIHDEILSQVPLEDAEDATEVLRQSLCGEFQGMSILAAASEPSPCWRDAS